MRRSSHPRSGAGLISVLAVLIAMFTLPSAASAADELLRRGDRGPAVQALNERLSELGYLPAAAGSTFGEATFHGVVAFQKWEGLARDGIVGPATSAALDDATRPQPLTRAGAGRRIEVLFGRQVALLIRDDQVRRTIAVSTGAPGYRTPTGSFRVFRKELRSWSYPYQVWLPYASYFHGGVAFHGYDPVPVYPASHGCVRVPMPFMRELYRFARMGTRVRVIYRPGVAVEAPSSEKVGP
jgi:peptidoglycan hydrolase-like protein with peptidoglycan-binding domain